MHFKSNRYFIHGVTRGIKVHRPQEWNRRASYDRGPWVENPWSNWTHFLHFIGKCDSNVIWQVACSNLARDCIWTIFIVSLSFFGRIDLAPRGGGIKLHELLTSAAHESKWLASRSDSLSPRERVSGRVGPRVDPRPHDVFKIGDLTPPPPIKRLPVVLIQCLTVKRYASAKQGRHEDFRLTFHKQFSKAKMLHELQNMHQTKQN